MRVRPSEHLAPSHTHNHTCMYYALNTNNTKNRVHLINYNYIIIVRAKYIFDHLVWIIMMFLLLIYSSWFLLSPCALTA